VSPRQRCRRDDPSRIYTYRIIYYRCVCVYRCAKLTGGGELYKRERRLIPSLAPPPPNPRRTHVPSTFGEFCQLPASPFFFFFSSLTRLFPRSQPPLPHNASFHSRSEYIHTIDCIALALYIPLSLSLTDSLCIYIYKYIFI